MSGVKIYNVGVNGVRLSKGWTVQEFKSWIISTLGGSSGDIYQSVIQSNDGGFVAVGFQGSQGQGSNDALIVKYDSNLNVIKQAGLGGSLYERYESIIQSNDGGYVVVGYQSSHGQGSYDALIVKYDSNLNVIKQSGLGGSSGDIYQSVIQSNDGGYVAVGYQGSQGQGNNDALIVKYDSNLNVIKQAGLGGSSHDYYESVIQSNDGGYVAVGFQGSQGQGGVDALIVKYDSNLNVIKQSGLGGSGSDRYQSVIQSNDGGYVAVGFQGSQGQGSWDALIVKYDSNLNVIKQSGLGGSGSDLYQSIIQSSDGGYVAVGCQASQGQGNNDALIVKYDSNLNVIKKSGLGGSGNDYYESVIQSDDGGYVAVGYQVSQGQGGADALITKLPSDLVVEGTINNHIGLVWTEPTLVETSPTLTVTSPTLVETSPTLTVTSPTLVETSPTLVETRSEKQ